MDCGSSIHIEYGWKTFWSFNSFITSTNSYYLNGIYILIQLTALKNICAWLCMCVCVCTCMSAHCNGTNVNKIRCTCKWQQTWNRKMFVGYTLYSLKASNRDQHITWCEVKRGEISVCTGRFCVCVAGKERTSRRIKDCRFFWSLRSQILSRDISSGCPECYPAVDQMCIRDRSKPVKTDRGKGS